MQLTTNFKRSEFDSKDGSVMPDSVLKNIKELAKNIQIIRDELGSSITINSGYRSPKHNASVGGEKNSKHILGQAGDLSQKKITPKQLYDLIEKLIKDGKVKEGGLGLYNTFVHYDIRGTKARWDYRK